MREIYRAGAWPGSDHEEPPAETWVRRLKKRAPFMVLASCATLSTCIVLHDPSAAATADVPNGSQVTAPVPITAPAEPRRRTIIDAPKPPAPTMRKPIPPPAVPERTAPSLPEATPSAEPQPSSPDTTDAAINERTDDASSDADIIVAPLPIPIPLPSIGGPDIDLPNLPVPGLSPDPAPPLPEPATPSPAPTATPPSAPTPAPAPETDPAPDFDPGGEWVVQILATPREGSICAIWQALNEDAPLLFRDAEKSVRPADVGGAIVFRLRSGAFATRAAAADFCNRLKVLGHACFVAPR